MPSDLLQRIARNLRSVREVRGLTREQLAASAEVDPQMIKRIESARANPALTVLSRLAAALMISASLVLSADAGTAPLPSGSDTEPFDAATVGETLSALRKNRQLSRRSLARMADIRAITLSRYETAAADARILAIEPLAGALGLDAEDLVRTIELRQRQIDLTRGGWHSPAAGVEFRLITSGDRSQLWEYRLGPAVQFVDEAALAALEEVATAIRGEVRIVVGDEVHRLRRGASMVLPGAGPRRFENAGRSTARLLRFQVTR